MFFKKYKLYYDCTCGFAGECNTQTEQITHTDQRTNEKMTVCVRNIAKTSPNWFQQVFGTHKIIFMSDRQKKLEDKFVEQWK